MIDTRVTSQRSSYLSRGEIITVQCVINNSTSSSAGQPFPSLFRAPGNHLIDGEAAWVYLDRGVPLRGEHNGIERSSRSIKYHRYKYELTKAGDRSWIRIDKSRRGVGPPQRRIDHFRNGVVYTGRTCIIGPDKLHFARFYYNAPFFQSFLFIYLWSLFKQRERTGHKMSRYTWRWKTRFALFRVWWNLNT